MTKITKEYRTLVRCTADLELGVKMELISLGAKLVSAELITPEQYHETRNLCISREVRAANLVEFVQVKVQQDPECFHVFIDVLKNTSIYKYVHVSIEVPRCCACCCMVIMAAIYIYITIVAFSPSILVPREPRHHRALHDTPVCIDCELLQNLPPNSYRV